MTPASGDVMTRFHDSARAQVAHAGDHFDHSPKRLDERFDRQPLAPRYILAGRGASSCRALIPVSMAGHN